MNSCNENLLQSRHYNNVVVSVTSRCNLRCIYCGVSQPTYRGSDMDLSSLSSLIAQLKKLRVDTVNFNGHGETTMIEGWHRYCRELLDAGFSVGITSNFGRDFSDEELDTLSRLAWIQVSCDTVDRPLFRELRRHADLNKLLANMAKVRAMGLKRGRAPKFGWTCVVNDRVVDGLENWFWVGLASGVGRFVLSNYIKMPDLEGVQNVRHLADLPTAELGQAVTSIESFVGLAQRNNVEFELQGDLLALLKTELADRHSAESAARNVQIVGGGDATIAKKIHTILPGPGETRDCLDPWSFAMIYPQGGVVPCCWWYGKEPIGNIGDSPFDAVVNDTAIRQLRSELLAGDLNACCMRCPSRSITTTAKLQSRVATYLGMDAQPLQDAPDGAAIPELDRLCREGQAKLEAGDIDAAVRAFADALQAQRDFAPALEGMRRASERLVLDGEACFGAGDLETAEFKFLHALQLNVRNVVAHNNLGVIAWSIGERDAAIRHFSTAHALDPEDGPTVNNFCDVLLADGQLDAAKRIMQVFVTAHPDDKEALAKLLGMESDPRGVEAIAGDARI